MIKLADKPNVYPPDGSFNFGSIKDDDGSGNGTPVNRLVYDDLHQYMECIMEFAEITPNGLLDSDDNGYQLIQAHVASVKRAAGPLLAMLAKTIIGNESAVLSTTPPAALLGNIKTVSSATTVTAGYVFYQDELFFCGGFSAVLVDTLVYTKVAPNVLVISDAVSGSGLFDYGDLVFVQKTAPKISISATTSESGTGATAILKFGTNITDVYGVYDNTNGKYTPKKAGFHQLNVKAMINIAASLSSFGITMDLYKNGSQVRQLHSEFPYAGNNEKANCDGNYTIEANGSTDYFEVRINMTSSQTWSMLGHVVWNWIPNN